MTVFDECLRQFRILLQAAHDAEDAHLDIKAAEDAQEPPRADARPIFEDRFDHRTAHARIRRKADIGQHTLRRIVALEQAMLAAGLDIEIHIHRNPRAARPLRVRRMGAVATEIARGAGGGFGGFFRAGAAA
jgi:hypothetical protein